MIAALETIFDYEAQPKVYLERCNLCQAEMLYGPLQTVDRYGYRVGVSTCSFCSLVFLNPRMTREGYVRFYENGYRPLLRAYETNPMDLEQLQLHQNVYAQRLTYFLDARIDGAKTLLDVGGSMGVVARALSERYDLTPTVLEPAVHELEKAHDVETINAFAEDFQPNGRTWDFVTLCQTVDHLLDIFATLEKLKACLSPGGRLFVDALNFQRWKKYKLDHPYYLTEHTMRQYLEATGFRVVAWEHSRDGRHLNFLARAE